MGLTTLHEILPHESSYMGKITYHTSQYRMEEQLAKQLKQWIYK
jgi:hypothetical protein